MQNEKTKQNTNHSNQVKITTELKGSVLLIGINRPDKRNAFDIDTLQQLGLAYAELENNPTIRCGVLFAHGEHFTGGLDLAKALPIIRKERGIPHTANTIDPWSLTSPLRTKPIVSAVQGYCYTLGIELMLATDIAIAADNARFAQIEIKRGIFPFGGATIRFVQSAGWGNAMRYLLTGDEFTADDALRMGLVQEVVKPGQQLNRAIELAELIADQAPLGVKATLLSARQAIIEGHQAAYAALMPTVLTLMQTEDAQEGVNSFLEKRKAKFIGK